MQGKTEIMLKGGPNAGITTIQSVLCRDRIRIPQDIWLADTEDGKATVMKGPIEQNWTAQMVAIYKRTNATADGRTIYAFDGNETIDRCESGLDAKPGRLARRCRNEAIFGQSKCRAHQKKT